jgi:hypothetical protein
MKRWNYFFLFLFFFAVGCKQNGKNQPRFFDPQKMAKNQKKIDSIKLWVKEGDLVFRNGNDDVSRAARSFNRKDTSFSHCGLVFIENDSVLVYHALGGTYNPGQHLMRQPIDSFCNPKENTSFGIYRYLLTNAENKLLKETVKNYYNAGLRFDLYFNFQSDNEMYCAEFVFKSLNKAKNNSLMKFINLDTLPYGVTTDDLFLNPNSKLVKKEVFSY